MCLLKIQFCYLFMLFWTDNFNAFWKHLALYVEIFGALSFRNLNTFWIFESICLFCKLSVGLFTQFSKLLTKWVALDSGQSSCKIEKNFKITYSYFLCKLLFPYTQWSHSHNCTKRSSSYRTRNVFYFENNLNIIEK